MDPRLILRRRIAGAMLCAAAVLVVGCDRPLPTQPLTGLERPTVHLTSLAAGYRHTCGLTDAGAAYCWGYNGVGALGDGTIIDRWIPTLVTGTVPFTALTTVYLHTCGLTATGHPYCWGDNRYGQLGDGTTEDRWTPTAVTLPADVAIASLATGSFHTCATSTSGTPYCWGANIYGQLGDGTTADRWIPTAVGQP